MLTVHRTEELRDEDIPEPQRFNFLLTTASLVAAFALSFVPGVGYLALLLLLLPVVLRVRYRAKP